MSDRGILLSPFCIAPRPGRTDPSGEGAEGPPQDFRRQSGPRDLAQVQSGGQHEIARSVRATQNSLPALCARHPPGPGLAPAALAPLGLQRSEGAALGGAVQTCWERFLGSDL